MAVDIKNLIAAIVPDVYCIERDDEGKDVRNLVKKLAKEKGYLIASEKSKLVPQDELFSVEEAKLKPLDAPGIRSPFALHKLVYDSPSESLEPIYFWILDFIGNMFKKIDKLVDNFVTAPGSAHFTEIGMKASRMQEEASKILGNVNTVLKSVLNIVYDLKEFKLRLEAYNGYKNAKGAEKNAYLLSLKQIWLDKVDINRGNTSIKGMAQQYDYVTLIDGFMVVTKEEFPERLVKKPEDGGLDLNERVRRILQQRLAEFFQWVEVSEIELRKRFEIERNYLKSQVSSLKLYSRWVKPYLQAAQKLEQNASESAALVTTFNTMLLELSVLAQAPYEIADDVATGTLPDFFKTVTKKKYNALLLIDLKFRGIPQRAGQGFTFGGRTEINFFGFALNNEELKVLKDEITRDSFKDTLSLIEGVTTGSLEQIEKDINDFLEPNEENKGKKKEERKESQDDINPFSVLFSWRKPRKKEEDNKEKAVELTKDSSYEKVIRSQAIIDARDKCFTVFETYKKAHFMPTW